MPKLDVARIEQDRAEIFRLNLPLNQLGTQMSKAIEPYTVSELVEALEGLRQSMFRLLTGLEDRQVNYTPDASSFSLSEIFTHVVVGQNATYNLLLDTVSSDLPHIDPLPRGDGDGSRKGIAAKPLLEDLQRATTELIRIVREVVEPTASDPSKAHDVTHPLFGSMTYKAVLISQINHDLDHLKQAQLLRRFPGFPRKSLITT